MQDAQAKLAEAEGKLYSADEAVKRLEKRDPAPGKSIAQLIEEINKKKYMKEDVSSLETALSAKKDWENRIEDARASRDEWRKTVQQKGVIKSEFDKKMNELSDQESRLLSTQKEVQQSAARERAKYTSERAGKSASSTSTPPATPPAGAPQEKKKTSKELTL